MQTAPHTGLDVHIVDCDVHPMPRSLEELLSYMPEPWASRYGDLSGSPLRLGGNAPGDAQRDDAWPPSGGRPCSDPDFTAKQLFGDAGVDYAILVPQTCAPTPNSEHEAAFCAATNAWLADTWLSRYNAEDRYWGSICVSASLPATAVEQIDAWAEHPRFKQVLLRPASMAPLGQPQFQPIFEAAARHGLPIAIHTIRSSVMQGRFSPVGFSSYFAENHTTRSLLFMTHLVSFVMEGVFEKFPELKLVLVEGGFAWIVPLLWRMDNNWEQLRDEVPWLTKPPSQYVLDHVRFTSQPIEEPASRSEFNLMVDLAQASHVLLFATDYPHFDFDDPHAIVHRFPEHVRNRILRDNALALYGLPRVRQPAGSTLPV